MVPIQETASIRPPKPTHSRPAASKLRSPEPGSLGRATGRGNAIIVPNNPLRRRWPFERYNGSSVELNGVHIPIDVIADICRRYGASRLSVFGSILRDDFHDTSDVDLIVEFLPKTRIGLIGMANMEADLARAIGRRVDLRTPGDLSRLFRDEALRSARVLHAA